jgi:hypothetical protein
MEGQEERIRGHVTAKFQVNGAYCYAGEQRNIAFSQRGFPLDGEGSGEIYTGNLKGPGSSDYRPV